MIAGAEWFWVMLATTSVGAFFISIIGVINFSVSSPIVVMRVDSELCPRCRRLTSLTDLTDVYPDRVKT